MLEFIDVIDINRLPIGKVIQRGEMLLDNEYFLSVHVWIVNSKKQFLLQRRVLTKKVEPGKWSVSGGVVDAGESSIDGCCRETLEEVGIVVDKNSAKLILKLEKPDAWGALVDVWLVKYDGAIEDIVFQKEEVSDVRWASVKEIRELYSKKEFSSNVFLAFDAVLEEAGLE